MNITQAAQAAAMAANRTAYSLARELLGVRVELKTQRDQAIHNQHLFAEEAQQHQAARREANALRAQVAELSKALEAERETLKQHEKGPQA